MVGGSDTLRFFDHAPGQIQKACPMLVPMKQRMQDMASLQRSSQRPMWAAVRTKRRWMSEPAATTRSTGDAHACVCGSAGARQIVLGCCVAACSTAAPADQEAGKEGGSVLLKEAQASQTMQEGAAGAFLTSAKVRLQAVAMPQGNGVWVPARVVA